MVSSDSEAGSSVAPRDGERPFPGRIGSIRFARGALTDEAVLAWSAEAHEGDR